MTKLTKVIIPMFTVFMSSFSSFAAQLSIPDSFEFLAADGTTIKSGLFSRTSSIPLTNGMHNIALRYNELIVDDFSDSHKFVKSAPFIISIFIDGDDLFQLKSDSDLISNDPERYAQKPKIVISRNDGETQYKITQIQVKESGFLSQVVHGSTHQNFRDFIAQKTRLSSPNESSIVHSTKASTSKHIVTTDSETVQAKKMLEYWWQQADKKTKEAFLEWASSTTEQE
ncbi:DUF2057 domain-containing protein [Parashewanella spongiae]|uniref:DUF2057 domain-containing protein n=1 Tax=Parashewanella spongiae TaxID=342950 RepID=A0A3A6U431_9GAMM|nr:DUF2057 domain-containing protein [Parashewanella spongiae]MCL1077825.1 DUF2057 domain-containing protein [Parashewanella spongiae]RJY18876.1 DUF2057 domain-containing protein [Parashewanella spongiae]